MVPPPVLRSTLTALCPLRCARTCDDFHIDIRFVLRPIQQLPQARPHPWHAPSPPPSSGGKIIRFTRRASGPTLPEPRAEAMGGPGTARRPLASPCCASLYRRRSRQEGGLWVQPGGLERDGRVALAADEAKVVERAQPGIGLSGGLDASTRAHEAERAALLEAARDAGPVRHAHDTVVASAPRRARRAEAACCLARRRAAPLGGGLRGGGRPLPRAAPPPPSPATPSSPARGAASSRWRCSSSSCCRRCCSSVLMCRRRSRPRARCRSRAPRPPAVARRRRPRRRVGDGPRSITQQSVVKMPQVARSSVPFGSSSVANSSERLQQLGSVADSTTGRRRSRPSSASSTGDGDRALGRRELSTPASGGWRVTVRVEVEGLGSSQARAHRRGAAAWRCPRGSRRAWASACELTARGSSESRRRRRQRILSPCERLAISFIT